VKVLVRGLRLSRFFGPEFKAGSGACQAVDTPGCRTYLGFITA
jgi:hypothetical protein